MVWPTLGSRTAKEQNRLGYRKATHCLDGQHQDVHRTLRGRVNQNDREQTQMEEVRPWCGQPSDRGRPKNRTELPILETRRHMNSRKGQSDLVKAASNTLAPCPLRRCGGIGTPVYDNVSWAPRVFTPNRTSIRSAVFAHQS